MSHRQRALAYSTECNSFPHSYRLRHLLPHRELGADYLKRSLLKRLERLEVQVAVHNVVHPVTLPA